MAITKLKRVAIHNYKSLRYVELFPAASDFTVLVGRNGAGKSNLADAFDFIMEVYKYGLEHAIVKKGGYENIAHRKERRSRSAISIEVELTHIARDSEIFPTIRKKEQSAGENSARSFSIIHKFSFKATGQGIRSEFFVSEESLDISVIAVQGDLLDSTAIDRVHLSRNSKSTMSIEVTPNSRVEAAVLFSPNIVSRDDLLGFEVDKTELISSYPYLRPQLVGRAFNWLQNIAIFQLTPEISRSSGVPTPNPSLSARGENLPAVVDWLRKHQADQWSQILMTMRDIVPEIEDITVDYLHTRTLGIFFKERGVGRAWTSDEVSDGTIRSLAMLVACYDPRASMLFIEEPENSLHPWIIKVIMSSLRKISKRKPVFITTHSPILLNSVNPEEVWVVYKEEGETHAARLVSFDNELSDDWAQGKFKLFDYIEAGLISQAVPSGSSL